MAFGFLNSIIPDSDKNVTLYTSPANTLMQGKVSISSKVTNPVRIRISIREAGGQITDLKYLEYNKYVNYAEVVETVDINIGPEQDLVVRCDHPDVSFLLSGETFDESNADLGPNVNSGLLGSLISTNTDKKELYKVPFSGSRPDLRTDATVVICNVGPTAARARIGLIQTGDILSNFSVEDYIEYEVVILPGQTYTRPGVKLVAGESIAVSSSDSSNLQFLLHGRLTRETGDVFTKDVNASGSLTVTGPSIFNTNLVVSGILTAPSINGNFPFGTLVGSGVTINSTGIDAGVGIITATRFIGSGSSLTDLQANQLSGPLSAIDGSALINISNFTGVVTATKFDGDGSLLTNLPGITTEALVSSGIVTTLNLTAAQDHKVTASGITTITVSGGTEAESHTVRIINSGITTVGFSTHFLFPSGSAPSLPTADGEISLISFTVNRVGGAGTQLLANASLNFS